MDTSTIQTIIIVTVQLIVGGILLQQIRSQKQVINAFKKVVDSAENIIALHNREIEQLKKVTDFDKEQLKTIALELGIYVDYYLTDLYKMGEHYDTKDTIDRKTHIDRNMPHCSTFLQSIHHHFHAKTPKP